MSRGFAEVVREMNSGRDYDELSDELAKLVQHVIQNGAGGSITFELAIKPNGMNSIKMASKITTKLPRPRRAEAMFFATDAGDLQRDDPRQPKLPLRSVPEPERVEPRKVEGA